jgi:imidazolonepropionase
MSLLVRRARLLTLATGARPRRGPALRELGIVACGDVLVRDGKIAAVGPDLPAPGDAEIVEADGRVLMPGFVDCHTHACWAGDRIGEWAEVLGGTPYLDILKRGGGIHTTVRAVRAATEAQLAAAFRERLERILRAGTTTVEVKSGYGLTTEAELKMLHAIRRGGFGWPGTVVPTALLGHAIEGDPGVYTQMVVNEMLPAVAREFPGITVDAYCERAAWPVAACVRLFERAREFGLPVRVHTDQFNSLGLIPEALRLRATSVDHLEAITDADLAALTASDTIGVVLPVSAFETDRRFAPGRRLVDSGGSVALATNCNPGNAPTHSMPLAIALAVRCCGLTPAEAITAATVNAASVLGLTDRGMIAVGQRADLVLLRHRDERLLAYELGDNPVDLVICDGQTVAPAPR